MLQIKSEGIPYFYILFYIRKLDQAMCAILSHTNAVVSEASLQYLQMVTMGWCAGHWTRYSHIQKIFQLANVGHRLYFGHLSNQLTGW